MVFDPPTPRTVHGANCWWLRFAVQSEACRGPISNRSMLVDRKLCLSYGSRHDSTARAVLVRTFSLFHLLLRRPFRIWHHEFRGRISKRVCAHQIVRRSTDPDRKIAEAEEVERRRVGFTRQTRFRIHFRCSLRFGRLREICESRRDRRCHNRG